MSDRRPEKRYVDDGFDWSGQEYREATPDQIVAVVRRGVESGEIEGDLYDTSTTQGWEGIGKYRMTEFQGPVLVIPVPDEEGKRNG